MNSSRLIPAFLIAALLALASTPVFAGIFISVNFAPPPLPVYVQPVCPDDGYIWAPGYWAYGDYGYYWVPGTWVLPPRVGVFWTPGYWGWGDGAFFFHEGYWGPHVGFYGGINYGCGYFGHGYGGGRWDGGHFYYNTAVNNVTSVHIHNTFVDRTVANNVTNVRNVSYNGGNGGLRAQPTAEERQFAHEQHITPTSIQQEHIRAASLDRHQLASVNGGRPATLTATRPEAYRQIAQQHAQTHPLTQQDKLATQHGTATSRGTEALPQREVKPENSAHLGNQNTIHESHPSQIHNTELKPHNNPAPAQHAHPQQIHAQAVHPRPQPHPQPQHNAKPQPHPDKPEHR